MKKMLIKNVIFKKVTTILISQFYKMILIQDYYFPDNSNLKQKIIKRKNKLLMIIDLKLKTFINYKQLELYLLFL